MVAAGLLAMGVRSFYALVSFGLCTFVLVTVAMEFCEGRARDCVKDKSQALLPSVIELTHRNTRRYGGYMVHMGVVIMFIGFTGKAFDLQKTVEIHKGDMVKLGNYQLRLVDVQQGQNENYRWQKIVVDASKNGAAHRHDGAGKAAVSGEEGAGQRSGDPPASERGSVHQFRGLIG